MRRLAVSILGIVALCIPLSAQGTSRVVVIKVDGLPGYYVDQIVKRRDPRNGHSMLPWINEIFYKNGTRVPNFYTRGMSLSGPSWGQIDTGQHLQIKGNVEFDRLTLHAYDYLNFIPYYFGYVAGKKADMPAAEVMDQLQIPLLCDAFPYARRYTSQQLYQRGNDWGILANGFVNMMPKHIGQAEDEWTLGFDYRSMTVRQNERDIEQRLADRPKVDYLDYYYEGFDHVSHHNNDTASRVAELKNLDQVIGRIWTAIQASTRASETALVLVSDHGFNSDPAVYSQGFNLVKLLASAAGGGHHVVTKRRLMLDYSIKGLYPFVPLIRTSSHESYYLNGKSDEYPTALVDFDGNERSSIHLRDSDLNILHILLLQLKGGTLAPNVDRAARDAFFSVLDRRRAEWSQNSARLSRELDALHRWTVNEKTAVESSPKPDDNDRGAAEARRRRLAQVNIAVDAESDYWRYLACLDKLLSLDRVNFDPKKISIDSVIAPNAMGSSNSIFELQNYVVGPRLGGLRLRSDGSLDLDQSFVRINYFELLHDQRVKNNVQAGVSNRPVDMVAARISLDSIATALSPDDMPSEDPVWIYDGPDSQALILTRKAADGSQSYKYLPISHLSQDEAGNFAFAPHVLTAGLPLHFFEDPDLAVPQDERSQWLSSWHSEIDWLRATHMTTYSDAIIALNEQIDRHPVERLDSGPVSDDEQAIRQLRQYQRQLTEADMLVVANDHWNFDVRGFNPGGNHGSFFRVSTNSTLMFAGGAETGIPKGLTVDEPYDNLGVTPTILRLMGKVTPDNEPVPELKRLGFTRFPGRVVQELFQGQR